MMVGSFIGRDEKIVLCLNKIMVVYTHEEDGWNSIRMRICNIIPRPDNLRAELLCGAFGKDWVGEGEGSIASQRRTRIACKSTGGNSGQYNDGYYYYSGEWGRMCRTWLLAGGACGDVYNNCGSNNNCALKRTEHETSSGRDRST